MTVKLINYCAMVELFRKDDITFGDMWTITVSIFILSKKQSKAH